MPQSVQDARDSAPRVAVVQHGDRSDTSNQQCNALDRQCRNTGSHALAANSTACRKVSKMHALARRTSLLYNMETGGAQQTNRAARSIDSAATLSRTRVQQTRSKPHRKPIRPNISTTPEAARPSQKDGRFSRKIILPCFAILKMGLAGIRPLAILTLPTTILHDPPTIPHSHAPIPVRVAAPCVQEARNTLFSNYAGAETSTIPSRSSQSRPRSCTIPLRSRTLMSRSL